MNFKELTSFIENHKKKFKDFSMKLNSNEIKDKDIFISLADDPVKNELHIKDAVKKTLYRMHKKIILQLQNSNDQTSVWINH